MLKILFVDDDAVARRNIVKRIDWAAHGWDLVYTARDGVDALEFTKYTQPDVIISDIKMPIMDGIELANIAREYYPELFFIFLSGYKEFEYAKQAIALKAIDYLNKPISNEELIEVLERAEQQCKKNKEINRILNERYPLIQRQYISKLMFDNFKEIDDTVLQVFDINMENGLGIVMFMEMQTVCSDNERNRACFQKMCKILTKTYRGSLFFGMDDLQMFIIYTQPDCHEKERFIEKIHEMEAYINQLLKEEFLTSGIFYHGEIMQELKDLYGSYQKALQEKNSEGHMLLLQVKRYIESHFQDSDMTLTYIAEHFHINHCYLTRLYKEQFGVNLYDYLIQVRMEKSIEYLKTTDMKQYEIAEAVGYKNSQYFSISFKKHYGCTVGEYRKKYGRVS